MLNSEFAAEAAQSTNHVDEVPTANQEAAVSETPNQEVAASANIFGLGSLEIEFGVPSYGARAPRVAKNNEKYPTKAVLTMFAAPTEAKKAFRFELNSTAEKALGLLGAKCEKDAQEYVAFSFKVAGHLLLVNVTNGTEKPAMKGFINYTKSSSFADKISHEYLTKTLNIDASIDNEFELTVVPHNDYKIVNLTLLNAEKSTTEEGELNIPVVSENY